jgi:hypothetical protein
MLTLAESNHAVCFGLSLGIVFKSWYSIRKLGPRHPAFEPPQGVGVRTIDDEDDDFRADEPYDRSPPQFPQEMTAVRPSNVGGYCEYPDYHVQSSHNARSFLTHSRLCCSSNQMEKGQYSIQTESQLAMQPLQVAYMKSITPDHLLRWQPTRTHLMKFELRYIKTVAEANSELPSS